MIEDTKIVRKKTNQPSVPVPQREAPEVTETELDQVRQAWSDKTYEVISDIETAAQVGITEGAQRAYEEGVRHTDAMFRSVVDHALQAAQLQSNHPLDH